MKLLYHFSPLASVGGCEINALRVIEGLKEFNHHVLVFDERGPMSAPWESAGARVDHLGAWTAGARPFRDALATWLKASEQPLGIFYWSNSRLPIVINACRRWNAPLVVHLGNPAKKGFRENVRRWMQERFLQPELPVTLVACSNYVAASHRRAHYYRRFPTKVIYNPVVPAVGKARSYRPLPSGSVPRVGMVARLDSIKDHATVIRALAKLASVRPDIVLEFAGDGSLRKALELEAQNQKVSDRVRFLGFTKVEPLLAEWDIYIHSTTVKEGMGTAVAEALMAGLPCIVSDLPAMHEVCGGDGAKYVAPGDENALSEALLKLIKDQAGRATIGSIGQRRARGMFALPQVAKEYLRVVSEPAG